MFHSVHPSTRTRRRGIAILEVLLSAVALGIVAVSVVQATVGLDRARAVSNRLDYASRELENSLKQFTSGPPNEINQASADKFRLPAEVARRLPGAQLITTVTDQQDPTAKRVTMKLQLVSRGQPLVLTTWVPVAQVEAVDQEGQP